VAEHPVALVDLAAQVRPLVQVPAATKPKPQAVVQRSAEPPEIPPAARLATRTLATVPVLLVVQVAAETPLLQVMAP
jgi:hypothetical protein